MESSTVTEITINGKTYHSVDEMPPDVRAQYEQMEAMFADKNNNGIPDIAEDGTSGAKVFSSVTTSTHTFPMDGSMPGSMGGSPSLRSSYNRTASGSANGEVQMSRTKLIALLVGMVLVAAGVTLILSR